MKKTFVLTAIILLFATSVQAQEWKELSRSTESTHLVCPSTIEVKKVYGVTSVRYWEKVELPAYEMPTTIPKQPKSKNITSESAAAFITGAAGGSRAAVPSAGGQAMLKFTKPYKAYVEVKVLDCYSKKSNKVLRRHYDAKGNTVETFKEWDLRFYEKIYPGEKIVRDTIYETYCPKK